MRVRGGRVQKKNNWRPDRGDYLARKQDEIRIDRRDPGPRHRHLITIAQLRTCLNLLPDWEEAAIGLEAIVLDREWDCMGWCSPGVVAICAWERDLWDRHIDASFVDEHRHILELLGVEHFRTGRDFAAHWTEGQARAFQLLHILPHELGHHHDRMSSRRKCEAGRGEPFAESYANRVLEEVWPTYARVFAI